MNINFQNLQIPKIAEADLRPGSKEGDTAFSTIFSNELVIQANSDGSAQINFSGGGRHLVKPGIKTSIDALQEAYGGGLRVINVGADKVESSLSMQKTLVPIANSDKPQPAQVGAELLTITKSNDGSAHISFIDGGRHKVLSGGLLDPVEALKRAYGARITAIVNELSSISNL